MLAFASYINVIYLTVCHMRCISYEFRDLAEKVKMGVVILDKDAKQLNNVVNSIDLAHFKDYLSDNS